MEKNRLLKRLLTDSNIKYHNFPQSMYQKMIENEDKDLQKQALDPS
jgi:hypothetical protein